MKRKSGTLALTNVLKNLFIKAPEKSFYNFRNIPRK